MQFRIADTFTDSLARLTGDEQKAVKTTAFDLQLNPASPGMSFHKLDRAKVWEVQSSLDVGAGLPTCWTKCMCSVMDKRNTTILRLGVITLQNDKVKDWDRHPPNTFEFR